MVLELELRRPDQEIVERFSSLKDLGDVADLLEVSREYLVWLLYRTRLQDRYRTFEIRKRSGGIRQIQVPPVQLKILQSKLNTILGLIYRPKQPVHGFVVGRGILSNARRHVKYNFVLNIDLKDFFPSINYGRVRGVLMAKPYSVEKAAATVLAQLCCYAGKLPQGAPTSPIISNMICARLDTAMLGMARKYQCSYTRYADDLTFSSWLRKFPEELAKVESGWSGADLVLSGELLAAIRSNGFAVNVKKQRLQPRTGRQQVTGLTVNEKPNVRRRYVRQVRAMLHALAKFGPEAAEHEFFDKYDRRSRNRDWNCPSFKQVIRGKLDFLKSVRGEGDPVYRKLANELNKLAPEVIRHIPEPPRDPSNPWGHWVEQYRSLIFQVEVKKDGRTSGGTAFAWKPRALATAAHVLDGEVRASPPLPTEEAVSPESFIFHPSGNRDIDVAVVKLPSGQAGFERQFPVRTLPLAHAEEIAVLGYAAVPFREPSLGFYPGVVESLTLHFGGAVETVQVTAEISGGLSGGPVIDRWGELVGVATETTFASTQEGVPARPFRHIIPIRYLSEIGSD